MTQPDKNEQNTTQNASGFAGTLRNIQLNDIIQMCCLAGASLCVRVRQDDDQGTIYVQEGEVVHAECGDMDGVDAFFTILGWQSGQFETMDAPAVPQPTIREPCQFLLMEAARQADEMASRREETPDEADQNELEPSLSVLIVDDSPIMAKILTSMLAADPSIEVAGTANNGEEALEKIKTLSPELITMDVNMPVMDGNTALKHIMISSPCPVLIMSNLGPSSYPTLLSFMNLGAVDFMSKPVKSHDIVLQQQRIVERARMAAKANVKRFQRLRCPKINPADKIAVDENVPGQSMLIALSGTGGYLEMVNLITKLPTASDTGAISLQSIPPPFAPTLASFLHARSRFDVRPFKEKGIFCSGRCYLGAAGQEIQFDVMDGQVVLQRRVQQEGRPGIDHLLENVAELFMDRVVVVLLSGADLGSMEGLKAVKAANGKIVSPILDRCILPASIEPAHSEGLITDTFDPRDMGDMLTRYCP